MDLKEKYKLYKSFFEIISKDEITDVILNSLESVPFIKYSKNKNIKVVYSPVMTFILIKDKIESKSEINEMESLYEFYNQIIRNSIYEKINDNFMEKIKNNPQYLEILEERHLNSTKTTQNRMLSFLTTIFSVQLEEENKEPVKKNIGRAYTHPYHSGFKKIKYNLIFNFL